MGCTPAYAMRVPVCTRRLKLKVYNRTDFMAYRFTTSEADPFEERADGTNAAWVIALAAAQKAEDLSGSGRRATFAIHNDAAASHDEPSPEILQEVSADDTAAA